MGGWYDRPLFVGGWYDRPLFVIANDVGDRPLFVIANDVGGWYAPCC